MDLQTHLAECEKSYSPEHHMLGSRLKSAGYHTTIPDGTRVHSTRASLDYALALLAAREASCTERAGKIVRKVLALQDTAPTSRTYGIWPYFLEEPLADMSPPDWNWADFCGALLLMMLTDHADSLPPDLAADMRRSLGHAAWSVFRRNVGPGYTNIAVMGAGVALAAGELLGEPRLVDYGRRRLAVLAAHTEHHGGFTEYNSPCYTMVALRECERVLQLARDEAARADAETLRRVAWGTIAEHFHPATGQWAGPHSRTYSDLLGERAARYLAAQTGVAIGVVQPADARGDYHGAQPLPCPPELVDRFRRLGEDPLTIRRRLFRAADEAGSVWGTTWLARAACLGSVSCDSLWTQRRGLIAYWLAPGAPAAVLRLRFLHDGRDFASACVRNVQRDNRVLSLVGLLTNYGDWHIHLDRPADGCFPAEDFRLRYELTAPDARIAALGDGRYELAAGGFRAVVHTAPGRFGGCDVTWETHEEAHKACLDAECYHGPRRTFPIASLGEAFIASALELLAADHPPSAAPLTLAQPSPHTVRAAWALPQPILLEAPSQPGPYP